MSDHPLTPAPEAPRPAPTPPIARLAYRIDEAAAALGLSRRTVERLRAAGKFPPPDARAGKAPLWRPATLDRWLAEGGAA